MKKLIYWIVFIPNIPIMAIASFIVIHHLTKNKNFISELLSIDEKITSKQFNEYLEKVYPKQLENVVAIIFYVTVILISIKYLIK